MDTEKHWTEKEMDDPGKYRALQDMESRKKTKKRKCRSRS